MSYLEYKAVNRTSLGDEFGGSVQVLGLAANEHESAQFRIGKLRVHHTQL